MPVSIEQVVGEMSDFELAVHIACCANDPYRKNDERMELISKWEQGKEDVPYGAAFRVAMCIDYQKRKFAVKKPQAGGCRCQYEYQSTKDEDVVKILTLELNRLIKESPELSGGEVGYISRSNTFNLLYYSLAGFGDSYRVGCSWSYTFRYPIRMDHSEKVYGGVFRDVKDDPKMMARIVKDLYTRILHESNWIPNPLQPPRFTLED